MRTIVNTYRVRHPAEVTGPRAAGALAERMAGSWVAVVVLVVVLALQFFLVDHKITGDGLNRYFAIHTWLAGHGLSRAKWPLVGSLPSVPLYLLGRAVETPEWWVSRYIWFVFAASLPLFYALLRRWLAADVLATFLLLLTTTSMLPHELMAYGAEPFSALAVGIGLIAWQSGRWVPATAALGLGVANMPATSLGLALAMGRWSWRAKQFRAILPIAVAAGIWMLENAIRRGSPLVTGYENDAGFRTLLPYSGRPGFSYPVFFGVISLLFSFGKGLLWFAPGLFVPFRRGLDALGEAREVLVLWLFFLSGMILVYAHWWAWYGGVAWGSRFLVFASLPASLLLAAQVRRPPASALAATAVVAALVMSCWAGADGVTFSMLGQDVCSSNHYQLESYCWYVPEFSMLWRPFVVHAPLTPRFALILAYAALVAAWAAWPALRQWIVTLSSSLSGASSHRRRFTWHP